MMLRPRSLRTLVAVVALAFVPALDTGAATPFLPALVDTGGDVGTFASLALDGRGMPHVAYFDATNGDLRYARWGAGAWSVEAVDTTGEVGSHGSLALDSQDVPRIAYFDATNADLLYAVRQGDGSWFIERVDTVGSVGSNTAIAIDGGDEPHVVYLDSDQGELRYAVRRAGVWQLETVDATRFSGVTSSIALDPLGRPHVSYWQTPDGPFTTGADLFYATKQSGAWTIELVDGSGDRGSFSSIAVDRLGVPRIAYRQQDDTGSPPSTPKLAERSNGVWALQTIDFTGSRGRYVSLALSDSGVVHVSYRDDAADDLIHAVRIPGGWTIEVADALGDAGSHTSIALDPLGNPKIAHFDEVERDLRIADSGLRLAAPGGGQTWPVGALRTIRWEGVGPVEVGLSVDGGARFEILASGRFGDRFQLRVPHAPSRFATIRVHRPEPAAEAISDTFFTIEADVTLLALEALPDAAGARLSWETRPGLEDLAGYRLERRRPGAAWELVLPLWNSTEYVDASAVPGTAYRLHSVNGLGGRLLLGTVTVPEPAFALAPSPVRIGEIVRLALAPTTGAIEVSLHDAAGRRVETIGEWEDGSETREILWRPGPERGAGVYWLRARSDQGVEARKVVVLP